MLANIQNPSGQSGSLNKDVHLPAASLRELLDFISDQLPNWRDRVDRKRETSETVLTSQLCAHLNSAARHSGGWDILQFRTEEPDEVVGGRKIDLVPAPCDTVVWVEGRRHADFDALLPIECKRLPTPKGKDRDEREYVFSENSSTGGIQRFKQGNHGANHSLGAMIGYIQQETISFWSSRVSDWIKGLIDTGVQGWSIDDMIKVKHNDPAKRISVLSSSHCREKNLTEIELRHLWIQMN